MSRPSRVWKVLLVLSIVTCGGLAKAAEKQPERKPEQVLEQLSEDVDMYSQLVRRASDPVLLPHWKFSLAWAQYRRGELLTTTFKRPAQGLRDLDRAVEFFRPHESHPASGSPAETLPTLPGVLFFRANALRALGRSDEALTSLDEAIRIYETCIETKNAEHLETSLAGFYQSRGELLPGHASRRNEALRDYDRAIAIYTKWSQKEGYEHAFEKSLTALQTLRDKQAQGQK